MKTIDIKQTDLSYSSLRHEPYYPREYDADIQKADIVFLPTNVDGQFIFSEFSTEIFNYLEDHCNELNVNIAVSDDNYRKIEKHCDLVNLGLFLVTNVALPVFVGLLANFLYDKLKTFNKNKDELSAEVKIIVEETKTKKVKQITYNGPVSGIKETLDKAGEKLFDEK